MLPPLILAPIAFLGSFVYGLTGFGAGPITISLASLFFDMPFVLAVFSLIDSINVVRVWLSARGSVSREDAVRLLPTCVIGVAAGAALILVLPARQLMFAFGVFILAYAIYGLLSPRALPVIGTRWGWLAGLSGGLTSALFGAGGPPFAIYLSMRPLSKESMRSTLALASLASIGTRIVAFAASGLLSSPKVWLTALSIAPATLLALWLAQRVHARLSRETLIKAMQVLLLFAGASLLQRALA